MLQVLFTWIEISRIQPQIRSKSADLPLIRGLVSRKVSSILCDYVLSVTLVLIFKETVKANTKMTLST